jgi:amino acid adenylation domain-containing protein
MTYFSNSTPNSGDYARAHTLIEMFEAQVLRTPNNIALIFEDQQITYLELNAQANQLAHYIRHCYQDKQNEDLKADSLIALYLDRSFYMIIGILGILKAGAAYVPIDSNSPAERTIRILKDTNTVMLLTRDHLLPSIQQIIKDTMQLIILDNKSYHKEVRNNLVTATQPSDLAYVIYTSGTTGQPKGVMQMHANVMRLFTVTHEYFSFSSKDVWTLYHAYNFDFSVWEMWGALLYGGTLIIPSEQDVRDMSRFYNLCLRYRVSILNQTPSAFQAFAQQVMLDKSPALALRFIIFGGEMLHVSKLASWWERMGTGGPILVNMYGITETTVHVTLKELSIEEKRSVIGKPLTDLKTYVLDKEGKPVSNGAIGELYISGAGLARGYLNQPELTQERFIANPFATEFDKNRGYTRLYKTGDLVRLLEHGELEYIGRNDSQVKIRGYRIELGEIEHALLKHPLIQHCVVIVRQHSNSSGSLPYLAAYFVSRRKLSDTALRQFLTEQLPPYMVPSSLQQVTSVPLTSNGKLDRKALSDYGSINYAD